jgi:glycosyltransferase involved in cell wall biosynthesis
MTDYVDHQDIPQHYALMSVLVLPTYREGFPTVLLEAGAMEVPVVATRVTGCVDAVIDGVTGILIPVRDTQALAQAIQTYLGDRGLAQRHGRAARARVLDEFQPESVWALLFDEYLRLLQEKRIPFVRPGREQVEQGDRG